MNIIKTPSTSPIFHGNNLATDFQEKVDISYSFHAQQYSLRKNHDKLPNSYRKRTQSLPTTVDSVIS